MLLRSFTFLAAAAAMLGGCAAEQPRVVAHLPPAMIARVTADAADQVKRCYRSPKVMGAGRRITTKLHVRYAPDGSIAGLPEVLSQSGVTPDNQLFADDMAQAAIASVMRCSPLRLPPELYAMGWNDFELTFSPALRG